MTTNRPPNTTLKHVGQTGRTHSGGHQEGSHIVINRRTMLGGAGAVGVAALAGAGAAAAAPAAALAPAGHDPPDATP